MKDYYKILGVTRDASTDLIRQRFRELALEHHPDLSENKEANEIFIEIYEAYHVLSQPDKKINYDLLYDKYFSNSGVLIPNEEHIKSDIQNVSFSAREKARQKAKGRYKDIIRDMDCFYISGLKADGKPYYYSMHRNVGISGGVGPMGSIKSGIINIPVPRSKRAYLFHQVGFFVKGLFLVLAMITFNAGLFSGYSLFTRAVISISVLFAGGLITMTIYRVNRVKSKFLHSGKYPLVKKYRLKGYKRGFHPVISTTPIGLLDYLFRLIF